MAKDAIDGYLIEINEAYLRGDATEHTHRPALKGLIEALGDGITATNEPRRIECGAPDMLVSRRKRRLDQRVGYIECKDIGTDLKRSEKTEQLRRYIASHPNVILTDYIVFRWYHSGKLELTGRVAREGKGGAFEATEQGLRDVGELIGIFLQQQPERITTAKELATRMAGIAHLLQGVMETAFMHEDPDGSLHAQFDAFRQVLLHDLDIRQFADMYAQTIAYGLFTARCHIDDVTLYGEDRYATFHEIDNKAREFTREHAAYMLPKTNPFLRKLFTHIAGPDLDDRIAWLVDDLVALLRQADMGVVLRDFARKKGRRDPVVHFYETFLSEYDQKMRKKRGVYYTPDEVVSYIVRSVDWLLKEKFGVKRGLADESKIKTEKGEVHKVLILDPAVGTGTFLFEVIDLIHSRFKKQKGMWSGYVRDHLLPRLFGFELMMAPYAIAHMKLGLELAETGYDFESDERLGIYLTNTLEEAEETARDLFAQWLSDEAREANKVKRDLPIMVVLGNPPYSGHSANASWKWEHGKKVPTFIGKLIQDYYYVDGKELGEKNPKWLQDDYAKFIRYGQYRIEQTGGGILAFITNHSYINSPTFRGMRQQLMQTFSEIYILDLHGNAKKKETCPDGSKDENVFDIMQGVSIAIFVKERGREGGCKIWHSEIQGVRKKKYEWLAEHEIQKTKWETAEAEKPFYLFNPQNTKVLGEYNGYPKITDVMEVNVLGFQTHRDGFAIDFEAEVLCERIRELRGGKTSPSEYAQKYDLKESNSWQISEVQGKLDLKQAKFFGFLCGKGSGFSGADFSGAGQLAG